MKRIIIIVAAILCAYHAGAQTTVHTLPPLPYDLDALQPVMSRQTLEYHWGKHVQAYVDNLNKLIPGTPYADASLEEIVRTAEGGIFNNGAQILNHKIFFDSFAPAGRAVTEPSGALRAAIDRDFGSFSSFVTRFNEAAAALFGSGWAWLAADAAGGLQIVTLQNAGNPLRDGLVPLFGVDVWEHSYYIDYRNDRKKYLENIWLITDWNVIERRYGER